MKVVVKKKRGLGTRSQVGGGREDSGLRPRLVEKEAPCQHACPSGNHIREFITTIAQAEKLGRSPEAALTRAWEILTETSPFPAVCGRVCSALCESKCNRGDLEGSVNIDEIERRIGDFGVEHGLKLKKLTDESRPQRIAVGGAGPDGLSCAYQLARRGYQVTVYEANAEPGGMLRYGISGFRLPKAILDAEIQKILDLGVELRCGVQIGRDITLDELKATHDEVFMALGSPHGVRCGMDGEDAPNVFADGEFVSRFHHGEQLDIGTEVIVIGGGDSAVDAARLCRRLGANVTMLYLRTRAEMPATGPEVDEALKEGVRIEFLAAPVAFRKDGARVVAVRAIRVEQGEPDASGRRRPAPIAGSEYEIPATTVISALNQLPDPQRLEAVVEGKRWPAVGAAVGHGRRGALAIERRLLGTEPATTRLGVIHTDRMLLDHYARADRVEPAALDVAERFGDLDREVNLGFTADEAVRESQRCMSCGYCFDCEKCWMYCQDGAIGKPTEKGELYDLKLQLCTGCSKCKDVCPCGFIDMV